MARSFFSWVLDADRRPLHETLAEHREHCRAQPGNCPFEKAAARSAENEDTVSGTSAGESEHDYRVNADGDRVPANKAFREKMDELDAAHKIYAISDIHSTSLDGMDIDGHGIVVIAGDFIMRTGEDKGDKLAYKNLTGAEKKAESEKWLNDVFIPWLKSHGDKQFVIIPGNHDKYFEFCPDETKWPSNVHFLVDGEANVNGLRFYGTPWCYYNMDGAFEVGHKELAEHFAEIPEGIDVLVAHTPPNVKGSDIDYGASHFGHFGSSELTDAILAKKPGLVLCGHVHSGDHRPLKLGDSTIVNVARVGTKRAKAGYAGRTIGFSRKNEDVPPEFIMDESDGQQIDRSAYAAEGESIKNLIKTSNGVIRWSSAYEILRDAAKAVNTAVKAGHFKPAPNPIGLYKYAKSYIEALPDGVPYNEKLKSYAAELEKSESGGYHDKVSHVEPPPERPKPVQGGLFSILSHAKGGRWGEAVKRSDSQKVLFALNSAAAELADAIGTHIDGGDFSPPGKKIDALHRALSDYSDRYDNGLLGDMTSEDCESATKLMKHVEELLESESSGWHKKVSRVDLLFR